MTRIPKNKIVRDKNLVKLYALSNPICELTRGVPDHAPHHIKYKGMGGGSVDDSHENLITLTPQLHRFCHHHGPKARDVLQSFKRGDLTRHEVLIEFAKIHRESR